MHRKDDNPTAIKERFELFRTLTTPVVAEFEKEKRCIHIDASQSVEAVHLQTMQALYSQYPHLCL